MGVLEATREDAVKGERTTDRVATRRHWVESAWVAVAVRLAFFILALAASWFLSTTTRGAPQEGFYDQWSRWDARLLAGIAENGYFGAGSDAHATAFSPLFPLLVRGLLPLGLDPIAAGLLVSGVASVVAGAYLHRLAEEEMGEGTGHRALLYLMLFPTAVFLVAPYTEALFLAGTIPAFYYARRQRWHLVALPAAVAMGTRFAGVFLLFGLAVEFLRRRDFDRGRIARAAGAVAAGALPLVLYCIYLAQATGDPFHFRSSQRAGWGRDLVGPVASFRKTFDTWNGDYPTNWLLAWRVEILAAVVGAAFVAWAIAKREWSYAAFMGSGLALYVSSTWYYSIPRLLLTFFPAMLFLAQWSKHSDLRHEALLVTSVPIAAMGVIVFTQGNWFF